MVKSIPVELSVSIDGGPLMRCEVTVERDYQTVASDTAMKPDPAWTYIDKKGHFHAWATGERPTLPTLRPFQTPCDGACGDPHHTVTAYECSICDEPVIPGYVPDYAARAGKQVLTQKTATVVLLDPPAKQYDSQEGYSLRIYNHGKELFGIGRLADEIFASRDGYRGTFYCSFLEPRL